MGATTHFLYDHRWVIFAAVGFAAIGVVLWIIFAAPFTPSYSEKGGFGSALSSTEKNDVQANGSQPLSSA